ncbi:PREDICTED: pentatricopeptide repeat-containing protein At4g26680, mitochondrial [Tarenaya hassleriana]|uniref:pentatricopeptide repeat-containing protein At4g26680, mitochondrial n=1 Tax=Tarenaya hassleriana TaxID=28532 RepID=UPI00053C317C|nr:PREDICTED: pentatricopeptide repeat-containing protein At4g26680, mitochondrial [Tarenaya hassleriana]
MQRPLVKSTVLSLSRISNVVHVSSGAICLLCYRVSSFAGISPESENHKISENLGGLRWNTLPIPHRTHPEPRGQDLDLVMVMHSHLIQSDWDKLDQLSTHFDSFRVKSVLLKIQKDHVLSLEFFNWVKPRNPGSCSLEIHAIILHILTKNRKFKSAESVLRGILKTGETDFPEKLFDTILYSYRTCESSPRVFDSLFKTYAHLKKFRNATDTFVHMKDYGFLPTVESCNAYLSSLLDGGRVDIMLRFYREMRRCKISPNVYTLNMVMSAYCRSGKLDKGVELLQDMERLGFVPTSVSYNTLIAGHCDKGLLSSALKLKNLMKKSGLQPDVVTFNTLIHGFCRDGKLQEASKAFTEMKVENVGANTITYNTLINGYSQQGNYEMAYRLYEEMVSNGIKRDILTYNALILGLCKQGKTRKAAYVVKELDKENMVPNSSTFSALIMGQCMRRNADRAFQLYKSMIRSGCHPNEDTFNILISAFCSNEDFDGAAQVLREMTKRSISPDAEVVNEIRDGLKRHGSDQLTEELLRAMEAKHTIEKNGTIIEQSTSGAHRG